MALAGRRSQRVGIVGRLYKPGLSPKDIEQNAIEIVAAYDAANR